MSTDQVAPEGGGVDDAAALSAATHKALMRLSKVLGTGWRAGAVIESLLVAPHLRKDYVEGGRYRELFGADKADQELERLPEIAADNVADALLLIEQARGDLDGNAQALFRHAERLGVPEYPGGRAQVTRGLGGLAHRRREIEQDERRLIRAARAAGLGWLEIGRALGYSEKSAKQTAYRRARNLGLDDLVKGGPS